MQNPYVKLNESNATPYQSQVPDVNNAHAAAIALSPEELEQRRQHTPKQFQDLFWAILFIAHLIVIIAVICIGLQSGNGIQSGSYGSIVSMVVITGIVGVVASIASLSFMMQHAEALVQAALVFSVFTSLLIAILGFLTGSILMGVIGLISFAVGICYAKMVWPRIPFVASNLNTALTAVKCNLGLTVVSIAFTLAAFAWTIMWFLGVGDALAGSNLLVVFFLFFSYYWVHQVLQNTMHVTTAGVIGTWWFVPSEANSFWSTALSDSVVRATTYSFGSVCFGSLLVALVQALRALEYHTRDSDDFQFLSCIIQCILSCLQGIMEEINRWAYIYVGLYGFSYLEAGRNVMQLFQHKGWTAIITDDLAENVLFMMSVAIGLISGIVGLIIGFLNGNMFYELGFENSWGVGFVIGFLSGFLFASIILSVVGSGVNTVIVCYAEDPAIFEVNHPQLSSTMRHAWVQAWPDIIH